MCSLRGQAEGIVEQGRPVGHHRDRAFGDAAQLDDALGNQVDVLLDGAH